MGQRSRVVGVVGVLGLAGALGWLLARCGIGAPGGGGGVEPEHEPAAPTEELGSEQEDLTVVVTGDRCRYGRETAQLCATMCDPIRDAAKDRKVVIDGSQGSHGVVVKLRKCLEDAGLPSVTVQSD